MSTNDDLAKLTELRDKGKLTDKQFEEQKSMLHPESTLPIGKNKPVYTAPPKKIVPKSKKLLLILLCVVFATGASIAIGIALSGPDPEVVTFSGGDLNSSLFDFTYQVHATIKNNGKAGNVIVNFKVTQDNHTFGKSQKLFLKADQKKDIMEEFAEVDMAGTVPEYVITVKAE